MQKPDALKLLRHPIFGVDAVIEVREDIVDVRVQDLFFWRLVPALQVFGSVGCDRLGVAGTRPGGQGPQVLGFFVR